MKTTQQSRRNIDTSNKDSNDHATRHSAPTYSISFVTSSVSSSSESAAPATSAAAAAAASSVPSSSFVTMRNSSRFLLQVLVVTWLMTTCCLACKYSKFTPQHTLCKPPSPSCASTIKTRGLTSQEKQWVLHIHNDYRRKVANGTERRRNQPSAANMELFRWDNELAMSAQRHAEMCKFAHDCVKCREVDRFQVGQNVYLRSSSREDDKVTWDHIIKGWYDEVELFPAKTVDSFQIVPGALHYSQMIWGDTNLIGCGYVHYKQKLWRKLFVCNYGPTGNWLEEPVYFRGKPCSACPPGTKCSSKYPGLCE